MKPIIIVESPAISSFSSHLDSKLLTLMPWAISTKASFEELRQHLAEHKVDSTLLITPEGKVAGIATYNPEMAAFGKKKKEKRMREGNNDCWHQCDAGCATKGGCASITVTYDNKGNAINCTYKCNDDTGSMGSIGELTTLTI